MSSPIPAFEEQVVDLSRERDRRRIREFRHQVQSLLDKNRHSLGKLFSTGAIYTRQGTRAGRNLLAAHQNLRKVSDLLTQHSNLEKEHIYASRFFQQLEILLQKSRTLSMQTEWILNTFRRN